MSAGRSVDDRSRSCLARPPVEPSISEGSAVSRGVFSRRATTSISETFQVSKAAQPSHRLADVAGFERSIRSEGPGNPHVCISIALGTLAKPLKTCLFHCPTCVSRFDRDGVLLSPETCCVSHVDVCTTEMEEAGIVRGRFLGGFTGF